MGNWKNRLKSHEVPLSAIWPGWEKLAKEKSHQKGTHKKNVRKKKSTFIYKIIQTNGFFFTRKLIKVSFQTMSIYLQNIVILWILNIKGPIRIHMF